MAKDLEKYEIEEAEDANVRVIFEPRGAQIEALCALENTRNEGAKRALVQAATGARRIITTGRKILIYKGFGPVFSFGRSPGQGKRGEILNNQSDHVGKNKNICRHGLAKRTAEVILYK